MFLSHFRGKEKKAKMFQTFQMANFCTLVKMHQFLIFKREIAFVFPKHIRYFQFKKDDVALNVFEHLSLIINAQISHHGYKSYEL